MAKRIKQIRQLLENDNKMNDDEKKEDSTLNALKNKIAAELDKSIEDSLKKECSSDANKMDEVPSEAVEDKMEDEKEDEQSVQLVPDDTNKTIEPVKEEGDDDEKDQPEDENDIENNIDDENEVEEADSKNDENDEDQEFDVNDITDVFLDDEEEQAALNKEEEDALNKKQEDLLNKEEKNKEDEENKDEDDDEEEDKKNKDEAVKKPSSSINEHLNALFNGETLTEDFQKKAKTIFEAAVKEKVIQYAKTLKSRYNSKLRRAKEVNEEKLVSKISEYMDCVVEEWLKQNKVAVENGLKTEITEEFITDLRSLFEAHNIMIPQGKENLVESLAAKVEKLESELEDSLKKNINIHKKLNEYKKNDILHEICEGLAATEIEKLKSLASNLVYDESYREKLNVIKENYFSQKTKKGESIEKINEINNNNEEKEEEKIIDDNVSACLSALKLMNRTH